MDNPEIKFGDKVRIRSTDVTNATGLGGQIGIVYGYTTPSVTGVDVIGDPPEDCAISVGFEAGKSSFGLLLTFWNLWTMEQARRWKLQAIDTFVMRMETGVK